MVPRRSEAILSRKPWNKAVPQDTEKPSVRREQSHRLRQTPKLPLILLAGSPSDANPSGSRWCRQCHLSLLPRWPQCCLTTSHDINLAVSCGAARQAFVWPTETLHSLSCCVYAIYPIAYDCISQARAQMSRHFDSVSDATDHPFPRLRPGCRSIQAIRPCLHSFGLVFICQGPHLPVHSLPVVMSPTPTRLDRPSRWAADTHVHTNKPTFAQSSQANRVS
ncbi:unnamed protein product [Protopolystoma xenopodis]|uniref:Uncharacterized protein n=1 Tax=Protopolystoma xenopodis TaxID=117903 RepID=A0A3S5C377_9PLAT|nr:unnamed protein product [Protopolystoma xenopodis]